MRTDDQLTRDLANAFRASTADLTYTGAVPTPRRGVPVALPAVAVVATAAGIVLATSGRSGTHPGTTTPHVAVGSSAATTTATQPASASASAAGAPTIEKLSLAGYTFSYPLAAGKQPLYGRFVAKVPAGATRVQTGNPVPDWIGVDPTTGKPTAYVDPGTGQVLAISSDDATDDELIAMLKFHTPAAIPVVGASDSQ